MLSSKLINFRINTQVTLGNLLNYLLPIFFFFLLVGCQTRDSAPKHVFFIVIDTLRADHLGCYDYNVPTSPTIDRLAKEGVLFKNAYSTASNTLESVFSFFTSDVNLNHQVWNEDLLSNYIPLQKCFKQAEYNTLAFISNPWLKKFQHLFKESFVHYQFVVSRHWKQRGIQNTTELVTKTALDFFENKFNSSEKNFFYIHYLDPHDPYKPPVDYGFFSGKAPSTPLNINSFSGQREVRHRYKKDPTFKGLPHPKPISENNLNYLISKYDGEIRHVDSNIENLLTKLQEMDVLKDSLIVITSDHGEEFLEHGCFKHGFQLYDETIHIPLIFYWPGHLIPMCKEELVSGIDIAPTILELCQINPPASMSGKNIFNKKAKEVPSLFCTHFWNQNQRGMRTDRWKLIENLKTKEIRIYNIKKDPEELNNLFDKDSKQWSLLFKTYNNLLSKHSFKKVEKKKKRVELDPETRKQLKALGYL